MYSEIGFIFSPTLSNFTNNDNKGNIYNRPLLIATPNPDQGTSQTQQTGANPSSSPTSPTVEEGILVYKRPNVNGTAAIKNYLVSDVYRNDTNEDPYISLLKYFNGDKVKALKLRAADFAYLKDLGVYPINRLWILRRFPDNCIVPNNLLDWGNSVEPIATVVGWMKDKDDSPMVTIGFNETWVNQTSMIDQVLSKILQDNFSFKLPMTVPVPGWSQGILFGMLNAMGFTSDYNAMNVPTGDPNVLRTAAMRDAGGSQSLQSSLQYTLETSYEQKYINGVDPGLAMLDIMSNLLKMGTSEQKFILSNSPLLQQLVSNINSNKNVGAWLGFIKELIGAFLVGVSNFITSMTSIASSITSSLPTGENTETSGAADQYKFSMSATLNNTANALLAGTVQKYRWELKGSIALMSGINTTPWHLTIGNPYSPIINIGNIIVDDVQTKLSNDLGFNDLPMRIDVTISTKLGRPLGRQEMEKMLNNGYKRIYSKTQLDRWADTQTKSSNTSVTGESAVTYVVTDNSNTTQQPADVTSTYFPNP